MVLPLIILLMILLFLFIFWFIVLLKLVFNMYLFYLFPCLFFALFIILSVFTARLWSHAFNKLVIWFRYAWYWTTFWPTAFFYSPIIFCLLYILFILHFRYHLFLLIEFLVYSILLVLSFFINIYARLI